jgi:hypothetical protein
VGTFSCACIDGFDGVLFFEITRRAVPPGRKRNDKYVYSLVAAPWLIHIIHSTINNPLVCGAFGGINKACHYLQEKIAAARAQKVWRELLCPSVSQARGMLLQHMQRRLCFPTAGSARA